MDSFDAVVIGAGFFGCKIALALKDHGLRRVLLVEKEPDIMRRASFINQARVHNGYHYPRSLTTAQRAHENYPRFCADYGYAVLDDMTKYYAIARGSRVTADHFERFCSSIGAPCRPAWSRVGNLFDSDLVTDVFQVDEVAFDASRISQRLSQELRAARVDVRLGHVAQVVHIGDPISVSIARESGATSTVRADRVFNCTYASLTGAGCHISTQIKHELAEMALIEPPPELGRVGVTVMDGPFFSVMPFPAAGLHSLSHVRYTPQSSWTSGQGETLDPLRSSASWMLRDAQRFMPCLSRARVKQSIFDVKAVLMRHENDDARPVLFEADPENPNLISILGSKIDNIYDVLDALKTAL